ncbi:MAG: S8 family serine peptidase [Acidobacteriota bacterium]
MRWILAFAILACYLASPTLTGGQTPGDDSHHNVGAPFTQKETDKWQATGDPVVPRLQLTRYILDSGQAVLEGVVRNNGAPYTYSVNWGDQSKLETGRQTNSNLKLTHRYAYISTFKVTVEVRLAGDETVVHPGKQLAEQNPLLVTVSDDDDQLPRLVWDLPPSVIRSGQKAVVGWKITDASGIAFVSVVIQGPKGIIARFDTAEGKYDLTGLGPGQFGIEVQTRDADNDRPGDSLGFMLIEIVTVTEDKDSDKILDYLDNCPEKANTDQRDSDGDGLGDVCDDCSNFNGRSGDKDKDGAGDACDNCPNKPNAEQLNSDGDLLGDACDDDDDNDGLADEKERGFGTDPLKRDTDGGGTPDGQEVESKRNPLNPRDDLPPSQEVINSFVPDRLLVRLAYKLPERQLANMFGEFGAKIRFTSKASNLFELQLSPGSNVLDVAKRLNSLQGPSEHGHGTDRLVYAVPDYLGTFELIGAQKGGKDKLEHPGPRDQYPYAQLLPDDKLFPDQTAFNPLLEAWKVERGFTQKKKGIVVALIDTGVDVKHEDLRDNIWRNENEGPGDRNRDGCPGVCGRDDDGDGLADFDDPEVQELLARGFTRAQAARDDDENGYVDDINGYDFVADSPNVTDQIGHGTHVAGVVGAVGNNKKGVAGVMWKTRLMPLKVARRDGKAELQAIYRAMRYASQNGADIVLHSYTVTLQNPSEQEIADLRALFGRTGTKHIIHIAAAGNQRRDLSRKGSQDQRPGLGNLVSDRGFFVFPVSLGVETVVSVAAHDELGKTLADFSNRGKGVVNMVAPGVNILSTLPGDRYGYRDGTADAAAYLAGVVGLLLNRYDELRNRPLEVAKFLAKRGTEFSNPEILTSLYYQLTNPPVLTGTIYDQTQFRFPLGFCGNNTYDADLFDADGDGDLDMLEVNGNPGTGINNPHLYSNTGGGRYADASSNLGGSVIGTNLLAADQGDIDNDGDLDLLFASFTPPSPDSNKKEILLINQGGLQGGTQGVFVNGSAELPDVFDVTRDVDFCDFDGDTFMDIFVTNIEGDRILRNMIGTVGTGCLSNPTLCFSEMTSTWLAGLANGDGHNSKCVDVDGDGDRDIITMNLNQSGPTGQNVLLINRINEVGVGAFVNETGSWNIPLEFDTSHGIAVADIDNDNGDSIYGGSGDDPDFVIARRQFGLTGTPQNNRVLIKANGSNLFLDQTFGTDGVPGGAVDRLPNLLEASTEVELCRLDSDADPDLLEANGDANYDVRVQNRFYRNKTIGGVDASGQGYFFDETSNIGIPLGYVQQSTDVECGDVDGDGDLDVLFANYNGCPELYINSTVETTPTITSISPTGAVVGEPVVIKGNNFGTFQGAVGRVTFGGVDTGTVLHWTNNRITAEIPVGSLSGGVPTPVPKGMQPIVVRTASGRVSSPVNIDIKVFNNLSAFSQACRCGDAGCTGPCLPDDYCRPGAGGCTFDGNPYDRRDIKDVEFGDVDNDGDIDILDVSSPMKASDPMDPGGGAGYSPAGCAAPVNFPDRLFINSGTGQFTDITGGADNNYGTAADNPLPFFHSFRTYDADFVDINNDGYMDIIRADRALCGGDPSHYFLNIDTTGDGIPDTKFQGFSLAMPTADAYWDNLAPGDVDGDGDLDLLFSHSSPIVSQHALFINNGGSSFSLYNPATMAPTHASSDDFTTYTGSAHDIHLVDLDDDRDLDIIIGGGNHGNALPNFVMLNRFIETGDLFFESVPIPNASENSATVHVGAADLNGDGRRDIHFVNDYGGLGPADRLFLNLGRVGCGSAAETSCPDGLSCSGAGLVVPNRICWQNASPDLPESVAATTKDGYGADYGDIDADGDLDILVTGLDSGGNYLFINRGFSACTVAADCAAGYNCTSGRCQPSTASTTPKWWSCPEMTPGVGGTSVPCRDQNGVTLTGIAFPAAQVSRRSLSVYFGDIDGDGDLDILWGRGQWDDWTIWPNSGPMIFVNPASP